MASDRLTDEQRREAVEGALRKGVERLTTKAADDERGPSVPIATLPRRDGVELRISWDTFKGFPYLSLRQWNRAADGNFRPDPKRGISIKKRELASVVDALQKAIRISAEGDGNDR